MKNSVSADRHGAVTVVSLDRPEVRNAVDATTARGHFCAGWDLLSGARMAQQAGPDQPGPFTVLDFSAEDCAAIGPLGPMGSSRLPSLIGMGHAMDLIQTGRKVEAAEALHQEWQRGKQCIEECLQGALRFAAGSGRHGKF